MSNEKIADLQDNVSDNVKKAVDDYKDSSYDSKEANKKKLEALLDEALDANNDVDVKFILDNMLTNNDAKIDFTIQAVENESQKRLDAISKHIESGATEIAYQAVVGEKAEIFEHYFKPDKIIPQRLDNIIKAAILHDQSQALILLLDASVANEKLTPFNLAHYSLYIDKALSSKSKLNEASVCALIKLADFSGLDEGTTHDILFDHVNNASTLKALVDKGANIHSKDLISEETVIQRYAKDKDATVDGLNNLLDNGAKISFSMVRRSLPFGSNNKAISRAIGKMALKSLAPVALTLGIVAISAAAGALLPYAFGAGLLLSSMALSVAANAAIGAAIGFAASFMAYVGIKLVSKLTRSCRGYESIGSLDDVQQPSVIGSNFQEDANGNLLPDSVEQTSPGVVPKETAGKAETPSIK